VTGETPCQLHVVARPWAIVNERWRISNVMAAQNDGMTCPGIDFSTSDPRPERFFSWCTRLTRPGKVE